MMTPSTQDSALPPIAIVGQLSLRRRARQLWSELSADADRMKFLDRLVAEELWMDSIRYLPVVMPLPDSVWWACLSCEQAYQEGFSGNDGEWQALAAAVDWTIHPNRENQQRAISAAAGPPSPARMAARAAATAGCITEQQAGFKTGDVLSACKAIATTAVMAAAELRSGSVAMKYRHFVEIGAAIAKGHCPRPTGRERPAPNGAGSRR